MYLDSRQKAIVKKALEDYDFIKEEIDEKIAKGYNLEDLSIYLVRLGRKDIEITNLESYGDYAYLDFLYKDLNTCVMWERDKGISVSSTFEIYDKEKDAYIVEDFLTKEEYEKIIGKTREEELEELVQSLKWYESRNLQLGYKEQERKVINFLKENW